VFSYIAITLILLSTPIYWGVCSAWAFIASRLPKAKLPSMAGLWTAKASLEYWKIFAIVLVMVLGRGVTLPDVKWPTDWKLPAWPVVVAPAKVTAVTYVHDEKAAIPSGVLAAISELNTRGILASNYPDDATDGDDQVPDQYKVTLPAAKASGIPSLVVQAGDKVLRTVKAPTTKAQVLEAVP
jgi:hypothetical protein